MESNDVFNRSLFEICQAMVSPEDLGQVLDTILDLTAQTLKADAGSILLFEAGSEDLKMLAAKGLPPGVMKRGYISRKGSITERVLETSEPVIVNQTPEEKKAAESASSASAIKSALCVPLFVKGEAIGTLNLNRYGGEADFFDDRDVKTVMILASQASICIDNARLYEENMAQARLAAIGQTVAGISHCVKNMLTGLRGGMGLVDMAAKAENWGASRKGAQLLRNNIERISLLVLDMLDYSKDKKKPIRRQSQIAPLFHEVMEITSLKAKRKSIEVEKEIEEDAQRVLLDPDQVFRCVLNLVENAIDSIDGGGRVQMRCASVSAKEIDGIFGPQTDPAGLGRVVRLTVSDTGSGISEENLTHLFEPFFSTKESRGTGLGLAVTHKIVLEHGGRVTVDSEIGKGTSFHLYFPKNIPEENAADSVED